MLDRLKRTWFILVLFTIGIYVPPLFGMGKDLAVGAVVYGMSFVLGYIYGAWKGFDITIPLFEILIFLPGVCIFYDFQWMYLVVAATITLFGNWLGYMWYCARMDEKNDVEVKNEDYVKSWMVLGDFVPKDKKKDMNRD